MNVSKTRYRFAGCAFAAACFVLAAAFVAPHRISAATAESPALPASPVDAIVFQAIRNEIYELQGVYHHKVAAVSADKVDEVVDNAKYASKWRVTVKYWLDYTRAEDVPFYKGMQRCLNENRVAADPKWVDWAESQVKAKRDELAEEIAFQQETVITVMVQAELDDGDGVKSSTVKVLHIPDEMKVTTATPESLGSSVTSLDAEIRFAPGAETEERMGYEYLRAGKDGTAGSGNTSPNQVGGQPGQSSGQPGQSGGQPGQTGGEPTQTGQSGGTGQSGSQSGNTGQPSQGTTPGQTSGNTTGGSPSTGSGTSQPSGGNPTISGAGSGTPSGGITGSGKPVAKNLNQPVLIGGIIALVFLMLLLVVDEHLGRNRKD